MTPLLDDVYTVLAKQHEPTARQFLAVRDRLALETESQRRFDQMVQALADSGWHGFEAAAGFLELSEAMVAKVGLASWLTRGQAALKLSRINFEPAVVYWRLVSAAARHPDGDAQLLALERLGLRVQDRFEFASHLLTDVLKSGEARLEAAEPFEFNAWVALTEHMVDTSRAALVAFLARAASDIGYTQLHALHERCADSCLDFLALEDQLNRRLPIRVLSDWWPILQQLARQQQGLSAFLDAMLNCPLSLPHFTGLNPVIGSGGGASACCHDFGRRRNLTAGSTGSLRGMVASWPGPLPRQRASQPSLFPIGISRINRSAFGLDGLGPARRSKANTQSLRRGRLQDDL